MSIESQEMADQPTETDTQIEAKAQATMIGYVTGFIAGIQSNLKTIGIIAFAIVGIYIGCKQYYDEHKGTPAVQNIWQHSGIWVSNIEALQMTVSNLQVKINQTNQ
jgi:hypothetical protein